ncbi:Protein TonB [Myxococcaceae bacterium]|nr:Protein TonB [Myxococcaceae bacterium]
MLPLRFPFALVAGCGLSIAMFWGLHAMIHVTGAFEAIQPAAKIEFVRLRRDSIVEEKKRVKPVFEKPTAPPPSAPEVATAQKTSVVAGTDIASLAPSVDFSAVGGGGIGRGGGLAVELATGGGVDRDAVPQVRIQPDYPISARQKGIEGWVDVQFSVSPNGSVRNPVVVASEPKSIFDSAALQAVRGWKYSPKIKDGKPVERAGLRVRIRFDLES